MRLAIQISIDCKCTDMNVSFDSFANMFALPKATVRAVLVDAKGDAEEAALELSSALLSFFSAMSYCVV